MSVAWRPKYEGDEIALGVSLAAALHAIPIALLVLKAVLPHAADEEEKPFVPKPVVAATLLKLGKPLDPTKLPDRLVPRQRQAPKPDRVASREDPLKKKPDAGAPPPPNAKEADLDNLIKRTDMFAEDAGKERPEEGHAQGVKEGTETDPNKVKAGDMYAAQLDHWFREVWDVPSVISAGQETRLCVVFQINFDPQMRIWHVKEAPVRASGNDLFDDSARSAIMKRIDQHTPAPTPPQEIAEQFRGRTIALAMGKGCK
jgi:hypothetical protein